MQECFFFCTLVCGEGKGGGNEKCVYEFVQVFGVGKTLRVYSMLSGSVFLEYGKIMQNHTLASILELSYYDYLQRQETLRLITLGYQECVFFFLSI